MDKVVDALAPKSVIVEKAGAILSYSIVRAVKSHFAVFRFAPEEPIRAELFSVERLEQHGESLAAAQRIAPKTDDGPAIGDSVFATTTGCCARPIAPSPWRSARNAPITPAADWLVDNFHVVDEQVREIRDDLPPGYLSPTAQAGGRAARRAIRACSGWPGPSSRTPTAASTRKCCAASSRAYQRVQPLTIGELWAVAITLRIVLVENLRRLAEAIVSNRAARQEADALADRLLGVGSREAEPADAVLRRVDRARVAAGFRGSTGPAAARSGSRR